MPRNIAKPLSPTDAAVQRVRQADLMARMGREETVTVSYVKRNGQQSSSTGKVEFFNGKPGFDTGSVTIADPTKGPRTINLHNIIGIKTV